MFNFLISAIVGFLLLSCGRESVRKQVNRSTLDANPAGVAYTINDAAGSYEILVGKKRSATIAIPAFDPATTNLSTGHGVNADCKFDKAERAPGGGALVKVEMVLHSNVSNFRSCFVTIGVKDNVISVRLKRASQDWTQVYLYDGGNTPSATSEGNHNIGSPVHYYFADDTVKEALVEVHVIDKVRLEKVSGICRVNNSGPDFRTGKVLGLDKAKSCVVKATAKIDGKNKSSVITFER